MSKKVPPPAQPAGSSFWLPFASIGLVGVLIGSTITYFAMRPGSTPATLAVPAAIPEPTAHVPGPELTAGQSPAQAERNLGNFYYDHQNWPLAIAHYESAIRQGSDDADIRTDLGNAYRFSGRFEEALAQYNFAQKQNPAHEFSLFNQGGLYLQDLKQPAKAIAAWQDYLDRFPNGQNVAAARQLIAQAQAGSGGPATAEIAGKVPPSAAEAIILKQLKAGQSKPGQP